MKSWPLSLSWALSILVERLPDAVHRLQDVPQHPDVLIGVAFGLPEEGPGVIEKVLKALGRGGDVCPRKARSDGGGLLGDRKRPFIKIAQPGSYRQERVLGRMTEGVEVAADRPEALFPRLDLLQVFFDVSIGWRIVYRHDSFLFPERLLSGTGKLPDGTQVP